MAYEQKPNSGTLFLNDKNGNERAPDMSGKLFIGKDMIPLIERGEMLRIAAWEKGTTSGGTLLSISVSQPQAQKQDQGESPPPLKSLSNTQKLPF
jgi:hypothetical protein